MIEKNWAPSGDHWSSYLLGNLRFRLNKALHRLNGPPRTWSGIFTQTMKALRYNQNNEGHMLFDEHLPSGVIVLLVYADDIIVTGDDKGER